MEGNLEQSARFTCRADRLGREVASRKHTFSAEHAEKLMKKHMRKKAYPVSIMCMEDRIRFRLDSPAHSSKHLREYAKYSDIRHIFIYSLSPCLFMLCVEDKEKKDKKYYESFRCHVAEDVNRLCELTATAKQTPTNTLPPQEPSTPPQTDSSASEPNEMFEDVYNTVVPAVSRGNPDRYGTQSQEMRSRAKDPQSDYQQFIPDPAHSHASEVHVNKMGAKVTNLMTTVEEADSEHQYQSPPTKRLMNQMTIEKTLSPVEKAVPSRWFRESVRSVSVSIVDSRRGSPKPSNKNWSTTIKSEHGTYISYRMLRASPELEYRRDELMRLFGTDVTFLSVDRQIGATICQHGSVFLYALREYDEEELGKPDRLLPSSKSSQAHYYLY
ncbi:hypothetical protein FGIG_10568 [Fasciola gigantica]|uniref:Trematode PH-like domain-containing protein n=1 Tax=Fasciola gigantica TaxID=46835 RepID=A0A504YZN8_FASGI|nr:hypothetical protein FGIG_10568 [Fasciola gigantica]